MWSLENDLNGELIVWKPGKSYVGSLSQENARETWQTEG